MQQWNKITPSEHVYIHTDVVQNDYNNCPGILLNHSKYSVLQNRQFEII